MTAPQHGPRKMLAIYFLCTVCFITLAALFMKRSPTIHLSPRFKMHKSYLLPNGISDRDACFHLVLHQLGLDVNVLDEKLPYYQTFLSDAFRLTNFTLPSGRGCAQFMIEKVPSDANVPPTCHLPSKAAKRDNLNLVMPLIRYLFDLFEEKKLILIMMDGALIGSIRSHGIPRWDDDFDTFVLNHERTKVKKLLQDLSKRNKSYVFEDSYKRNQHWGMDVKCQPPKECYLRIDFFFLWRTTNRVRRLEGPVHTFPINHIFPLQIRPLNGQLFPTIHLPLTHVRTQFGPSDPLTNCYFRNHNDKATKKCPKRLLPCSWLRDRYPYVIRKTMKNKKSEKVFVEMELDNKEIVGVFLTKQSI